MILNEGLIHCIDFSTAADPIARATLIQTLFVFISIVCAYLLGSINSAIIVSRVLYKDDIRKHGSGNAGLTNTLRTYGKRAAILTLIGDMAKTAISILIAGLLLGMNYKFGMSYNEGWCYLAALASVIGHIFPIYYGFKGGKGVLSTATAALILTPVIFLILLAVFVAVVAMSKYVSLGSVSVAVLYPVAVSAQIKLCFTAMHGLMAISVIALAIIIVWCHRGNLKRISDRTERKLSFKKKDVEINKENQ